ncbi:MAG: Uncharacterised protein [Flavobacteriaceae bacterium]|nr:MAG: Uncharacterised protein [Flavobacteriaceae bacterium]
MKDFTQVYHESGSSDIFTLGDSNSNGIIYLKDKTGLKTIELNGEYGVIYLGGKDKRAGEDGDLIIKSFAGKNVLIFNGEKAEMTVGGEGQPGRIKVRNQNSIETVRISGSSGDIEFLNADFAEEFDVREDQLEAVQAGTVMVLDSSGELVQSEEAYDSKVAGIIAGGGDYKPGIVMDKKGGKNRFPVALLGKVACSVDADQGAIQVGDLLTTSPTSGHAMKVMDKIKATGAIIGKALESKTEGKGLINVLINLQ